MFHIEIPVVLSHFGITNKRIALAKQQLERNLVMLKDFVQILYVCFKIK